MPVPGVTPTGMFGTPSVAATASSPAKTTLSQDKDKDMFLQLLAAQMKYQDPTKPTDSSQFLSQSAQFTALEKMQNVADQTAQLVSSQMAFGAANLVGRNVTWIDATGTAQSGLVDGVSFSSSGPSLSVAGQQVELGTVQSIKATPTA